MLDEPLADDPDIFEESSEGGGNGSLKVLVKVFESGPEVLPAFFNGCLKELDWIIDGLEKSDISLRGCCPTGSDKLLTNGSDDPVKKFEKKREHDAYSNKFHLDEIMKV